MKSDDVKTITTSVCYLQIMESLIKLIVCLFI